MALLRGGSGDWCSNMGYDCNSFCQDDCIEVEMRGTGKERKAKINMTCGYCQKVVNEGDIFIVWHKVEYVKVWILPVHVECWNKLSAIDDKQGGK